MHSSPHPASTSSLESPLAALHQAAGAQFSSYFGVTLPWSFGDSGEEYRLARKTVALIDTNYRAVLELTGPDRVRYLNAVLTSNVRDLAPGQSAIGLLLNAQGHILAELETLALDDRLLILGHKFIGERTAETLERFIIMDDATLANHTAETGSLAVEGLAAPDVVREVAGIDLASPAPGEHVAANIPSSAGPIAVRLINHQGRRSLYGLAGVEFLVRVEFLEPLWEVLAAAVRRHGGAPLGYAAIQTLRLEAGIPWFGADFGEGQIPQEAALESTHISFTKGCYPGQEIVERVRSRGHVNRRLVGLSFTGAETPTSGAALLSEGAEAGTVTSAAFSPLAGKPIGLGYLRREHNQLGQTVQCGACISTGSSGLPQDATVIELPLPGALAPATG